MENQAQNLACKNDDCWDAEHSKSSNMLLQLYQNREQLTEEEKVPKTKKMRPAQMHSAQSKNTISKSKPKSSNLRFD